MTCTIRSLVTVASILVANGVCAFVNVNGITSSVVSNGRHLCVPAKSTAPVSHRSSRRWGKSEKEMMKDGSRGVGGVDKKHREGPFSSLRESFKKVVRKSPFSTSRMAKDTVDDVLNSEAFLNKKVEMLKKQIAATQKNTEEVEAEGAKNWEEWGPQVERLQKEFTLIKNRGGEEAIRGRNKGKAEAINDILGVADNFERAAAAIAPETDGERAVVEYYKGVYDTMMGCLESLGLEEVENIGAPFDYNMHNAIMREPSTEFGEDVVCKVFQKGYRVGDTLVRPAMVAVASP